jgi:hypothetical protein
MPMDHAGDRCLPFGSWVAGTGGHLLGFSRSAIRFGALPHGSGIWQHHCTHLATSAGAVGCQPSRPRSDDETLLALSL